MGIDTPAFRAVRPKTLMAAALVLFAGIAGAENTALSKTGAETSVPHHYTWHEFRIPMRDGVELQTIVYQPDDALIDSPILLERTPYHGAPYIARPLQAFAAAGYIFVFQHVRGRYGSQGSFVLMTPQRDSKGSRTDVDESTDTFDTIDWLVRHIPHNNHRVGLRGISYPGFFAAAGMINAHPALKAVSPQAPQTDWFVGDDVHHHGAFLLDSIFGFMSRCLHRSTDSSDSTQCSESDYDASQSDGFDYGTSDGYEFFLRYEPLDRIEPALFRNDVSAWLELMQHGTYDAYWRARNLLPHLRDVRPAVLVVGGWYDPNDFYGSLHVSASLSRQSPATSVALVVGPWYHGQWEDRQDKTALVPSGAPTAEFFRKSVELPFFEHYLKDAPNPNLPRALMFETGTDMWRQFGEWPPVNAKATHLYLRGNGKLSFEPPEDSSGSSFDEYVSDPKYPVPYTPVLTTNLDPQYMERDQRFIRHRPDVVVYESEPLTSDITIAGPIIPHLLVSTTGSDSDWIVRLIDVVPASEPSYAPASSQIILSADQSDLGGSQMLVRGDVARAKFRNSLEHPQPMQAGQVTPLEFTMDDVLHTFKKGHRIMVQIHSTWFPLVDLNPQQFVDIYSASESDFRPATQRIYHSKAYPSMLTFGVLPTAQ